MFVGVVVCAYVCLYLFIYLFIYITLVTAIAGVHDVIPIISRNRIRITLAT